MIASCCRHAFVGGAVAGGPPPLARCVAAVSKWTVWRAAGRSGSPTSCGAGRSSGCCTTELIEADDILFGRAWDPNAGKASYAYSLRANDSRFYVSVDAAYPDEAARLRKILGDRAVVTLGGVGRLGRLDDGEPHFGAAGIQQNAGTTSTNTCTVGFTVRRNADGVRGAMTAGHCYGNGVHLYSGPQYYGYTWGKYNFPAYDISASVSTETANVIHVVRVAPRPTVIGDIWPTSAISSASTAWSPRRNLQRAGDASVNSYFCDQCGCTGGHVGESRATR
jgi:hypothetical protein